MMISESVLYNVHRIAIPQVVSLIVMKNPHNAIKSRDITLELCGVVDPLTSHCCLRFHVLLMGRGESDK